MIECVTEYDMSITDAKRMLSYGKLSICGMELSLHPDVAVSLFQRKRKVQTEDQGADQGIRDTSDVNTIQITNLPQITQKNLKLKLEKECNEKVDDVQMEPEDRTAVVRFKRQMGKMCNLDFTFITISGPFICSLRRNAE